MINLDLSYKEIYPKIFVYTDLFPDAKHLHDIIALSEKKSDGKGIYTEWTDWFIFGKYCHSRYNDQVLFEIDQDIKNKKEYNFDLYRQELILYNRIKESVNSAISHYIAVNNVPVPLGSYITEQNIGRYDPGVDSGEGKTMQYHTDYAIGEWYWPGEKFLITATTYMNDNYDGGEIMFSIGSEIIKYKPKAGEIIVFPSGSPLYPGGEPYFHAVDGIRNGTKSLVRMYVKHFQDAHQKWNDGESKHGKEEWYEIAKSRAEGHNSIAIFEGRKKLCSALVTKLYSIPYDSYEIKEDLFYDEDEIS
jgi:hypothetical protein